MGTREVYEEKLRGGNLDYDTTMNPGLGSARCPRCLSLLNPNPVSCQSLFQCFFLVMMVSEKKTVSFVLVIRRKENGPSLQFCMMLLLWSVLVWF